MQARPQHQGGYFQRQHIVQLKVCVGVCPREILERLASWGTGHERTLEYEGNVCMHTKIEVVG